MWRIRIALSIGFYLGFFFFFLTEVERIQGEIDNITAIMEEEITQEAPVTGEMIALLVVLSIFTVVGSVGNGLVLFVFSRVRDKTTAQLFILALAAIDLFTCMIIIPLTMFVEYTRYDIQFDWLCKLYQFLITSKVPLSAFIMVAIAFDRYFCICHPLRKIITTRRTKVSRLARVLVVYRPGNIQREKQRTARAVFCADGTTDYLLVSIGNCFFG